MADIIPQYTGPGAGIRGPNGDFLGIWGNTASNFQNGAPFSKEELLALAAQGQEFITDPQHPEQGPIPIALYAQTYAPDIVPSLQQAYFQQQKASLTPEQGGSELRPRTDVGSVGQGMPNMSGLPQSPTGGMESRQGGTIAPGTPAPMNQATFRGPGDLQPQTAGQNPNQPGTWTNPSAPNPQPQNPGGPGFQSAPFNPKTAPQGGITPSMTDAGKPTLTTPKGTIVDPSALTAFRSQPAPDAGPEMSTPDLSQAKAGVQLGSRYGQWNPQSGSLRLPTSGISGPAQGSNPGAPLPGGTPYGSQQNSGQYGKHFLTFRMPDGSTQKFDYNDPQYSAAIDQALASGAQTVDANGQPMETFKAYGGYLAVDPNTGMPTPLNVVAGEDWKPNQQEMVQNYINAGWKPGMGSLPQDPAIPFSAKSRYGYGDNVPTYGGPQQAGGGPQGRFPYVQSGGNPGWGSNGPEQLGNGGGITYDEYGTPTIGDVTLPETPMMNGNFDQDFYDQYGNLTRGTTDDINRFYGFDTPMMSGARLDPRLVPQVNAQTPALFDALKFLLSGQGYDPATLAKMKASSTEDVSRLGQDQAALARMQASNAGLADSPAANAVQQQRARQTADQIATADRGIDIQNAQTGLENLKTGAGMELNRQTDAASQANQVALQNASQMLQALMQNTQNQQQANQVNTTNQTNQRMTEAGAKTNFETGQATQLGSGMIQRNTSADQNNVTNRINRSLNQSQFDRQRDTTNVNTQNQRYGQGLSAFMSLVNGTNPQPYATTGATVGTQYTPNVIPANTLTNVADQVINSITRGKGA